MSLSVSAGPPLASAFDQHTPLDDFRKQQKSSQPHASDPVPARLSPYEQVEALKETGKSVDQIATALGLTPAQVDAELGIETFPVASAIPHGISVKA